MSYIQVGIPGVAQDKNFETKKKYGSGKPLRKKLYEYIYAKLGTDQSGFARMMSISAATVTQWLYTDRMPSGNVFVRMSTNLGLSYEEVLELFKVAP